MREGGARAAAHLGLNALSSVGQFDLRVRHQVAALVKRNALQVNRSRWFALSCLARGSHVAAWGAVGASAQRGGVIVSLCGSEGGVPRLFQTEHVANF